MAGIRFPSKKGEKSHETTPGAPLDSLSSCLPRSLLLSPAVRGQDDSGEPRELIRAITIFIRPSTSGIEPTKSTATRTPTTPLMNLGPGVRLFDYTLDMRSLDHNGLLFDNLSFTNFGYGGDPNDVTRLRIEKNKWYDFRLALPSRQEFLGLQSLGQPAEPGRPEPARVAYDGLHRQSADSDISSGCCRRTALRPRWRKTIRFIHWILCVVCRITI